jgi:aspartate/methionine/tyrosine aminotransferase
MTMIPRLSEPASRFEMPVQWAPMRSAEALTARTGAQVIHLEKGDFAGDEFLPAPHIIEACARALQDGKVRYAPGAGLSDLREAIAEEATKRGRPTIPNEVLVTFGAKHALTMSLFSLLERGDRVITPNPGYPPTEVWINYLGAEVVHAPLDAPSFSFDLDVLDRLLPSASLLILNSPQRPTGMLHHEVEEIAKLCASHGVPIISDEIFSRIVYPPVTHRSISTTPEAAESTIVIDTFSKSWQMTGFRIGWCIAAEPFVKAMDVFQQNSVTNVPVFVQEAALAAITGPQDQADEVVARLQAKRDKVVSAVSDMPGLSCVTPEATFYVMLDVRELGLTSQEFATELLQRHHVAVVPGTAFGDVGEGYVRLTFAVTDDVLDEGLDAIARAATELMARDVRGR